MNSDIQLHGVGYPTIQPSLFCCLDDELGELDEDQKQYMIQGEIEQSFKEVKNESRRICDNSCINPRDSVEAERDPDRQVGVLA